MLSLVFLIPVNQNHFEESKAAIESEGYYPVIPYLRPGSYFGEFAPGILDNSSDSIMIYTAMDDSEGNILKRAMNMFSAYAGAYSYYWHGYVTVLRPLFLVFNYGEIRILNGILQIVFILLLARFIERKIGIRYIFLLLLSYILLSPTALSFSLQYTWVFYIAVLSSIFLIKKYEYLKKRNRIIYFFLFCGMLTSYFDLLTYPLFTWGFPAIWWTLLQKEEQTVKKRLKSTAATGVFWIVGYGGMWALKWIFATIILKRDVWQEAVNEIFLRVGAQEQATWNTRMEAVFKNWFHYSDKVFLLVLLLCVGICIAAAIQKGWKWDNRYPAFVLIGCAPFVWYAVLANHTVIHHMFTYRIFNVGILAAFACITVGICKNESTVRRPGRIKALLLYGSIAVLAIIPAMYKKGENFLNNGEGVMEEMAWSLEENVELLFIPRFSHVTKLYLGVITDSETGSFDIAMEDKEGNTLYKKSIALERIKEQTESRLDYPFDVDWRVKAGEEYKIRLTISGESGRNGLRIMLPESKLLPEFTKGFQMDENYIEGQIYTGIVYKSRMKAEKKEFLFLWMTYMLPGAVLFTPILSSRRFHSEK